MPASLSYYSSLDPDELKERIERVRQTLKEKLLILAHHYTNDDVFLHADLTGDSFQLSAEAARNDSCETIVFCGVHFMAETADILANSPERMLKRTGKRVDVLIPNPEAGCSMADMATAKEIEQAWKELSGVIDTDDVVPITYVNSSAELKAFCGKHGGIACTSTNAAAVLNWAFGQKPNAKVLFFPDQHLGRNTSLKMGVPEEEIRLWNRNLLRPLGGNSSEEIQKSKIILWDGYCNIHQKFTTEQIQDLREKHPGIHVIVHPECDRKVVETADEAGSTHFIIQAVTNSPPGSKWAIGTEWRMVERLIRRFPEKEIYNLSPEPSLCETMSMNNAASLAWILENVLEGTKPNIVRVPDPIIADAVIALERMLRC